MKFYRTSIYKRSEGEENVWGGVIFCYALGATEDGTKKLRRVSKRVNTVLTDFRNVGRAKAANS